MFNKKILKRMKKTAIACIMATALTATSICTDGFCSAVHEMMNVEAATTTSDGFVIENGVLTAYTGAGGAIVIPSSVTEIGAKVFNENQTITSVTFAGSVTKIGEMAFRECDALTSVQLPDSLKTIDFGAFNSCVALKSIVLPDGVETIGAAAFGACVELESLNIPASLKSVGYRPFHNTSWQYKQILQSKQAGNNGLIWANGILIDGSGAEGKVNIPSDIHTIAGGAFGNSKITEVNIPNTVTMIDESSFQMCNYLTNVVIPSSITEIKENSFSHCPSLRTVTIPKSVTKISSIAFWNSPEVVISGYVGSTAETFANSQGIPFSDITTTPTPTPDPTATPTPKPTATPTPKPTATPTPKPTATPTPKPTATPTPKPTATPTPKPTATPTPKPTATPTPKPTATPTPKPTATATPTPTATPVPQYTITFNGMGGTVSTSTKQVTQGEKYGTLPTPEKTGYDFFAWCVNANGGTVITSDTYVNLSSNQTLYAVWKPKQYTVTLDPQEGTVSHNTMTVSYERAYSTLPIPVKENANFVGWYTADNQLVTNETYCKTAADHILHAVWETTYRAASLEQLTYQFGNHSAAFSYPSEYKIPLERYQYIYGDTILAKSLYTSRGNWGGNCFGISSTSTMFHTESIADARYTDFNAAARGLVDLSVSNISQKLQLTLTQMIEAMQIAQYDTEVQRSISNNYNCLDDLCKKVQASQNANGQPILICLYGPEGGHAVIGYKIEASKLYIYDPNYPEKTRSIELTQSAQGEYVSWYYYLNDAYEWKSGKEGCGISYVPFEVYKQVWEQRSTNRYASTNMLTMSIENAAIYDVEGNEVAKIEDGDLQTQNNEIYQVRTMELDENAEQEVAIYLPTDVYIIENTDRQEKEFSADMTHVNQGVSVTTEASKVTFAVNDQERINSVICNAGEGQSYSLSLQSTFEDDKKNVKINGTGTSAGEVGISQSLGNVGLTNCDMANVSIDGENVESYLISTGCSQGGTITLQGNETISSGNYFVVKGDSATYIMTPEDGYVLSDVLVDGVSVGAVPTYCFENVTEEHKIVAVFAKFDASAITVDSVDAQAHTGQNITPAITVRMGDTVLKENIDYGVVYSNNKNVGTAKAIIIGLGSYKGLEKTVNFAITASKGESYTIGGMKYQVTDAKKKEVMFVAPVSKKKTSVTIPKTVKIGSVTYKVIKIATKAFNGCSKLKKITVKSTYLTSVGSNAFKGIYKKAVIKVPASKLTKYKKLMKNKGQKKTVTIKK